MPYRPDIDGLRAVAVLSVVLCHAGLGFPGGYVGVDVFFVISGYLITCLLLKDLAAGTFSLARFWERRIRRILPALVVVVAASLIAGWFLLVPKAYQLLGRSVVSVTLLRSNVHFARHTDYFAPTAEEKPLLHTWSLAVEEQFYLVIPLVFWAAMRLRKQAWLGPIVVLVAIGSFAYGIHGTTAWSQKAYFLLSTRAWELLAGVLTAFGMRHLRRVPAVVCELAAVVGLAGVVLPSFLYDDATPFPGLAALPPVSGTVLLIVVGGFAERATWVQRLLASRAAVGVGLISYSLYLWHWPLLVFLKSHGTLLASALERGCLVATAAGLAFVTYRYVEQPFRRREFLASRPKLFFAAGTVFVGLLATGEIIRLSGGLIDRLSPQARLFAHTGEADPNYYREMRAVQVPHGLLRVGAADVAPKLLVWGDSHAMVILPAINEVCRSAGIAAYCAANASRPPLLKNNFVGPPDSTAEATAFGAAVVRYVEESPDVEAVLLAGIWSSYFAQPKFAESLLQTIDALRATGRRVYFLKDVPKYEFDVAATLIASAWRGDDLGSLSISLPAYEAQNRFHETFLPLLVERGVEILDPIPALQARSDTERIRPFDAGGSFYCDGNHLSVYGARVIEPVFVPVIDAIVERQAAPMASRGRKPADSLR